MCLGLSLMKIGEVKRSVGYGKPPWIFEGSALYQLHLVKAETARACIPKEFKLVEAFGYTLGGFFLANYDDSPAGVFDELVVIAGLVWNRSTSCAWAAKVLVNSEQACDHGRKEVGLPSQVARFSKKITAIPRQTKSRSSGFQTMIGLGAIFSSPRDHMDVQVTEIKCPEATDISNINLTTIVPTLNFDHWMGPAIKMSLPSFSGCTQYHPNLLKYSCQIECRVRAVQPVQVSGPFLTTNDDKCTEHHGSNTMNHAIGEFKDDMQNLSSSVLLSKPILALKFSRMKMQVEAPVVLSPCSENKQSSNISSASGTL
ncbi:Protein NEOXANTHIN-DEFICIENT 1 [Quillaja saponaria]|nr:Protein NEOXANTHIN-DEFICIENT 1 [Quillaja saponaria]